VKRIEGNESRRTRGAGVNFMRARTPLWLLLCFLIFSATGACPAYAAPEDIAVSPEAIDFGTTETLGAGVNREVTLANGSSAEINVTAVAFDLGSSSFIFKGKKKKFPVAAGATVKLPILFLPRANGEFRDTLVIKCGDLPTGEARIGLKGVGTGSELEVENGVVDFGEVMIGESGLRTLRITLGDDVDKALPIFVRGAGFDQIGFNPPLTDGTLLPGTSTVVTLRFLPGKLKRYIGRIAFGANTVVTLVGVGIARVGLVPGKVEFGLVQRNVFHTRTLEVRNNGSSEVALNLDSSRLDGEYFTVNGAGGFSLMPGEVRQVAIQFGAVGRCTHKTRMTLRIESAKLPGEKPQKIPITVSSR
jgi:hypothetical protein